ncbi:uncharacterized protein N7459_002667 [Penicillium hispanicum]|uniref:uncharacterized protein n=1 Tax=Penicillium hispanicum TaxID=1080232 RepID=UPI00253FEE28|nr:uncharacterized protein N7459_002667 [Penicillium hispanicum]KAJ5586902.1 hypothetical protein N7459_002667 [Penicillium hispanicum]
MAATLSSTAQRSAATLSTIARVSARQTLQSTSVLQRTSLSTASRGPNSFSQRRGSPALSNYCRRGIQYRHTPQSQKQVRWTSKTSTQDLRQWGFEEVTAALPSAEPSPTHKPMVLVDVREPAELNATGIIPTAINIPLASQPDALYLTEDEFETRFGFPKPRVDVDQNLVFYCKAGVRARAAAQMAVQAGYDPERIGVYDGSWLDWEGNKGKVERWEGDDY